MRTLNHTRSTAPKISPTILDLAWAAGVYEGEGSCELRPTTNYACITQKDLWILDKFKSMFGGTIWTNSRNVSRWYVTGARARGFLFTVYTFLSPWRRTQARKALGIRLTKSEANILKGVARKGSHG